MTRLIVRGAAVLAYAAISVGAQAPALLTEPNQVVLVQGAQATGLYHRTTCPWVAKAPLGDVRLFATADAKQRHFQPHCLCISGKESAPPCGNEAIAPSPYVAPNALAATPSAPALSGSPSATASASEVVYITRTGEKYHRSTCRFASSGSPTTLGEASARYGACAVCKPPTLAASAAGTASLAPAAPTRSAAPSREVSRQCAATTKKGTRCSRTAQVGRAYCWQH